MYRKEVNCSCERRKIKIPFLHFSRIFSMDVVASAHPNCSVFARRSCCCLLASPARGGLIVSVSRAWWLLCWLKLCRFAQQDGCQACCLFSASSAAWLSVCHFCMYVASCHLFPSFCYFPLFWSFWKFLHFFKACTSGADSKSRKEAIATSLTFTWRHVSGPHEEP